MNIRKLLVNFFFAALPVLLALPLTGCTDEIDVNYNNKPIVFSSSYVIRPVSRAAGDINNANVKNSSFYVFGQSYDGAYDTAASFATLFDKQEVTYSGGSWTYSPVKYWDPEKSYTFAAVMPEGIPAADVSYVDGKVQIDNVPLTQTIRDQNENPTGIDYLVSNSVDDRRASDGTVLLQFKHILSRFSVYVYTGDETATVTVNAMNLWLPEGTASYREVNHAGPVSNVVNATGTRAEGDVWTWTCFSNSTAGPNSTYGKHSLLTNVTPAVTAPYCEDIPFTSDAQLMPVEFFMAPIGKTKLATAEDLQLYMDIAFHVKYSDGIEQDIVRSAPVKIHDLHSFTQNYRTNLFVKLLSQSDVISFDVQVEDFENETNHWVDRHGYSFDLPHYTQTVRDGLPADEISGILYDYGNVFEGDSHTKMTYTVKTLTKAGDTTPTAENLPMSFSGWSKTVNGTYGTSSDARAWNSPYGAFTVDLSGVNYENGLYEMAVQNSMGDVRVYKINLSHGAMMAFTVSMGAGETYTIPFVTYETVTAYWSSTVGKYLKSKGTPITMEMIDGITSDENIDLYFSYPSNLTIDWGDGSERTSIVKGTHCVADTKLQHAYTSAGDYQIVIYSDAPYTQSQIPQISWGNQAVTNNPLASSTNGNGYVDSKIKSMDTPVLRIYDEWDHWETTFGAYALAARNGAVYDWMVDIVYSWINSSFVTGVKSSPITAMFHNSSIQHTANNLFIYNGDYARAADYTFLMCSRLDNIGVGMFDRCSNIVSMISTFDGDGNNITEVPDGLFDYLTGDVNFFQTFAGCPLTYYPSNLFDKCGAGSRYRGMTNVGKANNY